MNFGKWIVVAFVLFAMFIGTLVTVCVRQDISLVSPNYYNEELRYQDQITRINNTNQLSQKPAITKEGNNLQVRFGPQVNLQKGELKLFCPSDPKMDRVFTLQPNSGGTQFVDLNSLRHGMYKAKLLWTMDDKEYFIEETIFI